MCKIDRFPLPIRLKCCRGQQVHILSLEMYAAKINDDNDSVFAASASAQRRLRSISGS